MEQSTRLKIQEYFLKHQVATSEELSRALGLTRADIQYHLQEMVSDQIVELVYVKEKKRHPGRPARLYQLSPRYQPNNLEHLLISMFYEFIEKSETDAEKEKKLRDLANRMFPPCQEEPSQPMSLRLNRVIEILNRHHYRAHWEARIHGPRLIIKNCPYCDILKEFPEFCKLDYYILQNLLSHSVNQITKIEPTHIPQTACGFILLD